MKKLLFLSTVFVAIIYSLPILTNNTQLVDINLDFLPEFTLSSFENQQKTPEIITVSINNKNTQIDVDEYLIGVISAEMPASFEDEALKAQAVAGRTYIYYKQALIEKGFEDNVHTGAVVCDDYTHCKAYIDLSLTNPWGEKYDEYYQKMKQAVYETSGEYVVYDEEPIAAVFHSTSSGSTENAKDVWGSEIPYLVSVESTEAESPKYEEMVLVTQKEFKNKILNKYSQADFSSEASAWFKASERSESGGIIGVYVGGIYIKGSELRTMFGLNSTNFTVSFDDETVIFKTLGYGHGVGLSQYGANALAKDGLNYEEILTYYYTGTKIKN